MQQRRLFLLLCFALPLVSSIRIEASVPRFRPFPALPRGGSTATKSGTTSKKTNAVPKNNAASKKVGAQPHQENAGDHHDEQLETKRLSYNLIVRKRWARVLYFVSAFNPLLAVLFNDYSRMMEFHDNSPKHVLAKTYETLFFFAKLKPRVSFAIGAVFRALQLTTAFQYVFDPSIGVGFGLNLLALWAKSRWPATIVLGWTVTKPFWKILGGNGIGAERSIVCENG